MLLIFNRQSYLTFALASLWLTVPAWSQQSQRQRQLLTPVALCQFEGWSNETGETGLPVHLTPEAGGIVISRLPPPVSRGLDEFAVTVRVVGWRPGWFKIDSAAFPAHAYGPGTPRREVFTGQGWVPSMAIKTQLAGAALKEAPDAASRTITALSGERVMGESAFRFTPDTVAVRGVLACRGTWVHVDTELGRGWVARACAEQLGPCS